MKFKYKEAKKKILTSFLTISLLVSTPLGLNANEIKEKKKEQVKPNIIVLDNGFNIYLPEPSKAKVEKLDFEKENVLSRYYAHNGVYLVYDKEIIFRSFDYLPGGFIKKYNVDSKLINTHFLQIKKGPLKDYMLIFTLFKDGTFKYYVFKQDSKDFLINSLNFPKINLPDDTTIKIHDVDLEKNTYYIKIKSDSLGFDESFKAEFVLE